MSQSRNEQSQAQVTVPWLVWHNTSEQLKEARRLLKLAAEAGRKGESVDIGQIEGFLR